MKDIPGRLRALQLPAEAGPLPLAAGGMLGSAWLAPYLVRPPGPDAGQESRLNPGSEGRALRGSRAEPWSAKPSMGLRPTPRQRDG